MATFPVLLGRHVCIYNSSDLAPKLASLTKPPLAHGFHPSVIMVIHISAYIRSRNSVVGIATGYGLDDRGVGVRVPVRSRIFSSPQRPTQPPIQWVPKALSPGVKRQGREADRSPPTSAEVKKMWIYTSTLPYALMA
jgi:hypothetical protein